MNTPVSLEDLKRYRALVETGTPLDKRTVLGIIECAGQLQEQSERAQAMSSHPASGIGTLDEIALILATEAVMKAGMDWERKPAGFKQELLARAAVSAYLSAVPADTVNSGEEADQLPAGSVVILRNGTARLRADWSSGWASALAGDDYPSDDKGCFPATVLYRPVVES